MFKKPFFLTLVCFAVLGCLLSASALVCDPGTLELWINASRTSGTGLTPANAAPNFGTLLGGALTSDQPIIIYFMGDAVHNLPTTFYSPSYSFSLRCGVSFVGLEAENTINANYGLLLEAGYGAIHIANLTFQACHSSSPGGAIRYIGEPKDDLTLEGVAFQGCISDQEGGAIFLRTTYAITVQLIETRFYNCSATYGGGAHLSVPAGSINLYIVQLVGCSATAPASQGGGLFLLNDAGIQIEVTDLIATYNHAFNGAALFLTGNASMTVQTSEFSCNYAGNKGAAIYTEQGDTVLDIAWIYANINEEGAGEDLFSEVGSFIVNLNLNTTVACGVEGCCPLSPYTTTLTTPATTITVTEPTITTTIQLTTPSQPTTTTTTTTTTSTPTSTIASTSVSTTATFSTTTTLTTTSTTTQGTIIEEVCSEVNCSVLVFPDLVPSPSNTTLIVGNNTLTVDTSSNSTHFVYNFSWGSIYETDPELPHQVKGIDLSLLKWVRYTFSNDSHVFVSFQAMAAYGEWATHPIYVYFEATFSRIATDNATHSLKTSLIIEGDWQFDKPTNKLHVEMVLSGEFVKDQCGRSSRIRNSTAESVLYELYAPNNTITFMELLKYCSIDGVKMPQSVDLATPRLLDHSIIVDVVFPSFKMRLDYDPNLAVLLRGGSNNPCGGSLFEWILPVSFLIAAGIVIVAVIILGTTPWLAPYFLGREGARVHKLRTYVSTNQREIASDAGPESPRSFKPPSGNQGDW